MSLLSTPAVPPSGANASLRPAQNPLISPGGQAEQPMFQLDLGRSLERHRKLALGFILTGIVLGAAYLFLHWPIYSAEALVYIQPTPSAPLESPGAHWPYNYDPATYESYIQQQMLSMTRPDVLKDAVAKLGNDGWRQSGESDQEAAARLGSSVEVARVQNSYQVSITATARNAQIAADLANAVADAYIESTSHEQRAGDGQRMTILSAERDRVKKELASDRAEQAALSAQLGVAAVGASTPDHYDGDIEAIHAELVKARADHDQAEARLSALDGNNSAALNAAADEMIAGDSGLNSLKAALDTRRAALVSQMANLTPNHPLYKQDATELAKIDANLKTATQDMQAKAEARVQDKLRADLASTAAVEDQLNGELNQMTRAAAGAAPKLQRAADLASDITRLQTRYDALDERLQNQTIEDAAPDRAHVTNPATPPLRPSEHGALRNAGAIAFGFIFLGLLAAVMAHKLDPRVYVASDVEQILGFAPTAMLPDFGEVSDAVAEEHLLRLSSTLEHARRQGHLNTCIFTGTGSGTGTTMIAAEMRAFLTGMGKPAALVDAAAGRPHPSEEMDGTERGNRSLSLLQSMTEPAEKEESMVLTDTAPLTLSAETEYLARNADCAIVIMASGVTTRAELKATAAALQRLNVGTVGFVLNRVSMAKADRAFRNSVRAVEQHMRSQQRRPITDQPIRTRRVEAEQAPVPRKPAREPQVSAPAPPPLATVAEVQPALAPRVADAQVAPAAPVAAPEPVRASEPPLFIRAPEPAPAPQATPGLPPAAEPEMPWWMADPVLQAQRPTMPVMRGREPHMPPSVVPSQIASQPPAAKRYQETVPPPESRLSGLRNILRMGQTPAPPPPPPAPAGEDQFAGWPPAPPASAVEEAHVGAPQDYASSEAPGPAAVEEPLIRYRGEAFVPYPEAEPAAADPVAPEPSSGATRQVTTAPEFLPPRKGRWSNEATRLERRETVDDVAVLPSWRGQYRRKD